jgi:class 3 adenylate cyclase/tetratricopeptide (TPR) repeat protein
VVDDRIARLASRLVGEAEQAALVRDWTMVEELALDVLSIDADNAIGKRLLEQARGHRAEGGGGDRRQLTAMFCDLVGSTDLADQHDPEVIHELTRGYQEACTVAIDHHGGSVFQFQGDGVVAYFCYPRSHEDDPLRAVLAGLEILDRMTDVRARAVRRWGLEPACRIGVHTGLVAVQEWFSAGLLRRGSVTGATPNLAARLQAVAESGSLVISDTTAELVAHAVETAFIGLHELRGISRPVGLYRVVKAIESAARFDLPSERLTPLVGRTLELNALVGAWDDHSASWASDQDSKARPGSLICAEPGLGKSRLARLLRDHASGDGATVVEVPCTSRDGYSLDPMRSAVARLVGIRSIDPLEVCLSRLRDRLGDESIVVPIAEMLDIPSSAGYEPSRLAASARREATLHALDRMLDHLTSVSPVLLLVEDIHWADPTTAEWIAGVAARRPPGVLVVATTRPEGEQRWAPVLDPLALLPLDRDGTAELVRAASEGPVPDAIVEMLVERSDGVPLFAEHLARLMWRSGLGDGGQSIPNTLQDLLQAQLDAAGDAKGYAQIAATIGRSWDVSTITNVMRRIALDAGHHPPSDEVVQHAMAELVRLDLVTPTGQSARRLRFRHALVRDAAYESQLLSERRIRHVAIADELTQGGNEHVGAVALHLDVAGEAPRAAHWYVRASEVARGRGEFTEAKSRVDRALELLDQIEDGDAAAIELKIRTERGVIASSTMGWAAPDVVNEFSRCTELCEQMGDDQLGVDMGRSLTGLWSHLISSGDLFACEVVGRRLVRELERTSVSGRSASIQGIIGSERLWRGDNPAARTALMRARDLYDESSFDSFQWGLPHDLLVAVQSFLGSALVVMGDEAGAVAELRAARERADRLDFPIGPFSAAYARTYEATYERLAHNAERAMSLATEVIELGERHGFNEWRLVGALNQAAAYSTAGRYEDTCVLLGPALDLFRALGAETGASIFLNDLADAHLRCGRVDEALAAVTEAMRLATERGHEIRLAESHRLHAEIISTRTPDNPEIAREIDRAIEVARRQEGILWVFRAATTAQRLVPDHRPAEMSAAIDEARLAYGDSTLLAPDPALAV